MRITATSKVIFSHASSAWSFVGGAPVYLSVAFLPHAGLGFQIHCTHFLEAAFKAVKAGPILLCRFPVKKCKIFRHR